VAAAAPAPSFGAGPGSPGAGDGGLPEEDSAGPPFAVELLSAVAGGFFSAPSGSLRRRRKNDICLPKLAR